MGYGVRNSQILYKSKNFVQNPNDFAKKIRFSYGIIGFRKKDLKFRSKFLEFRRNSKDFYQNSMDFDKIFRISIEIRGS